MRTIKLLLLTLLLASCSREELNENCECNKITYEYVQGTTIGANGLPVTTFEKVILSEVEVQCQDEQTEVDNGDSTYFDIECR